MLAGVIADAQRRLAVVSFAASKVPQVLAALEAAAHRGVQVDVILETAEDSSGALSFDELRAFVELEHVRVWHWPHDKRPAGGGSLHAKALVADGAVALVTSANLTERALAAQIESHRDGLRRAGTLVAQVGRAGERRVPAAGLQHHQIGLGHH